MASISAVVPDSQADTEWSRRCCFVRCVSEWLGNRLWLARNAGCCCSCLPTLLLPVHNKAPRPFRPVRHIFNPQKRVARRNALPTLVLERILVASARLGNLRVLRIIQNRPNAKQGVSGVQAPRAILLPKDTLPPQLKGTRQPHRQRIQRPPALLRDPVGLLAFVSAS